MGTLSTFTTFATCAALACSGRATPPPVVAPPAAVPQQLRETARVAAPCGADYLERHATTLSDLDGNGTLDRVSLVREAGAIVVRLFELPSFRERGAWKLPDGYVELATPRRRDGTRGDLWITVGGSGDKPWDGAAAAWHETLYHLEGGALVPITAGYRDARIRVDVDGDGRVDPIGSGGAVRALLAGDQWLDLPVMLSSHVHGAPIANEQEEAVDLDGNGVRELVLEQADGVSIVEIPAMRTVWTAKGKPWKPSLVRWGGALVLVVRLDDKLRIYTTDASHALVAEYPDAPSYADISAVLELAGDSRLVMTGHPWRFFDRKAPTSSVGSIQQLVGRLDDVRAPYGPLRLAPTDAPGLVALRHEPSAPLEIMLVDPHTRTPLRRIWKGEPRSLEATVTASLVDLDRDGASELVVEDRTQTVFHHGASWNTARMRIVDGAGAPLWQERATRIDEWVHEDGLRGKTRQTRIDGTHVRAFDLGDGTMPLRIRSARDEYYVVSSPSKIRSVPICLE